MVQTEEQKYEFKTEVKQLLDLVVHSLYSNKEIFLRELISNATDAIDRRRFLALTDKELEAEEGKYQIKIIADKKNKTLTISDNGIGMSDKELIDNLGTIAKSGTKAFLENVKKSESKNTVELIGQFGVGFYSAFMVAHKIEVLTRKVKAKKAYRWISHGEGGFSLINDKKDNPGTDVILYINKENEKFFEEWEIRQIVKKYSDFVEHPIVMDIERDEYPKKEDGTTDYDAKPHKEVVTEELNSRKAIWSKPKAEISEEEYQEFYKHLTHDYNNPFEIIHYSAEGKSEFRALLYFPTKAPVDLYHPEHKKGIQLFVKRVFIMDDYKHLVPEYLRFVKGVVDSSDLPLNVSREILQQDVQLDKIKKSIVNKIFKVLEQLQEKEPDRYKSFYQEFGAVLKEGINYDYDNKAKITELLMYQTSKSLEGQFRTLKEYVEAMPTEQKDIYYVLATNRKEALSSPHLEAFKKKGYEVILMTDPVDEWLMSSMMDYQNKKLVAVDKGELEFEDKIDKEKKKEELKKYDLLLKLIKEQIGSDIKDVRFSSRLIDSISCLVADEHAFGKSMEQMFRSMGQEVPEQKKILEINPDHELIVLMDGIKDDPSKADLFKDMTDLIYGQALLTDGEGLKNPLSFSKKVTELMIKAIKN